MLFLNPWMLLGLGGLFIPLLLHLFNRRKSNRRDWGAVMFLVASLAQRRRRMMVEEILLLVTRCLICTFAALCFARPFISAGSAFLWIFIAATGILSIIGLAISAAVWSQPGLRKRIWIGAGALAFFAIASILTEGTIRFLRTSRSGAKDIAIIIDGSSSMTITSDGKRNFDEAKKIADEFIESCPRNTAFTLIIGGSVSHVLTPTPTTDRRLIFRLLDGAVPLHGTLKAPDALALAVTSLTQGYNANKQVLLIGDGQSEGWDMGENDVWACVGDLFSRLPGRPKIVWRKLPIPTGLRNLAISGMSFSRDVIGTDREVGIAVTIANNGSEAATVNSVVLSVEGRNYTDSSIGQVQPGEKRTVSFHHRFNKTGTHPVTATLDVEDDMSTDNTLVNVAAVRDNVKVLIVESARQKRLADRPGAFIALALAPDSSVIRKEDDKDTQKANQKAGNPLRSRFLMSPELVGTPDLAAKNDLSAYSAIILADVPKLDTNTAARVLAFVEHGGGLMTIHSTRTNPSFYNEWHDEDGMPVMPLTLSGEGPDKSEGVPLDPKTLSHPGLTYLVDHGDLSTAIFENFWKASESGAHGTNIGGRLFDGTPLFADRKAGKGRIIQFAAALDPAAGNLISRQSFLPMVHVLVNHLAKPVIPELNIQPSRGVSIALSGGKLPDSTPAGDMRGLRAVYTRNDDRTKPLKVTIDPKLDFDWQRNGPVDPSLPDDALVNVEWTGSLIPPRTAKYFIYFRTSGDGRISFADDKKHFSLFSSNVRIDLTEGKRHDIVVSYRGRNKRDARFSLMWRIDGSDFGDRIIEPEYLSPLRTTQKDWSENYSAEVIPPDLTEPIPAVIRQTRDSVTLNVNHHLTPGVYTARIPKVFAPQLAEFATVEKDFLLIKFAVFTDGTESRLTPTSPDDDTFVARYIDFSATDNKDDMLRALNGAAIGRELWRYAAIPLLALVLLEILLTRWITDQRRTGQEGSISFDDANKPSSRFIEILNSIKQKGDR